MPAFDNSDATERYRRMVAAGISAVKAGDVETARRLLFKAAQLHPTDATPWLWLSATTQDPSEQREYLENAFAADPNNSAARRGLALLSRKITGETVLAEGSGIAPAEDAPPQEAEALQVFLCPRCGGTQVFNPASRDLLCAHCGTHTAIEGRPAADHAEQVMDFVLPTERGHRWAEAQTILRCERCGAETIFPAGSTAETCPYCGAHQWLATDETRAMLDPHAIVPFQVEESKARRAIGEWLAQGWTTPDDITHLARTLDLRPAYYPFWTFDGTLEMHWSCEVNIGNNKAPVWVPRSGMVHELFDDLLIPGLKDFPREMLERIAPFDLKAVLAFQPAYLAGWPALTYNIALSDASLSARQQVTRLVRRTLEPRLNITQDKRNLRTGGITWSDMTFKCLLLPLWSGTFRYRGKTYSVWVNGQTGKVGGQRPRDRLKVAAWVGVILLSLALIALLAFTLTR